MKQSARSGADRCPFSICTIVRIIIKDFFFWGRGFLYCYRSGFLYTERVEKNSERIANDLKSFEAFEVFYGSTWILGEIRDSFRIPDQFEDVHPSQEILRSMREFKNPEGAFYQISASSKSL